MTFSYTIISTDTSIYDKCAALFVRNLGASDNTYPLSKNINGNSLCPSLKWNNVFEGRGSDYFCAAPYFKSLTDVDKCGEYKFLNVHLFLYSKVLL